MDRDYLKGSEGDAINAVLAATGHNFRQWPAWLGLLLRAWLVSIMRPHSNHQDSRSHEISFFTDD